MLMCAKIKDTFLFIVVSNIQSLGLLKVQSVSMAAKQNKLYLLFIYLLYRIANPEVTELRYMLCTCLSFCLFFVSTDVD